MLRIYSLISGVIFLSLSSYIHSQTYGLSQTVDDVATASPVQSLRSGVTAGGRMPCIDSHTRRMLIHTVMRNRQDITVSPAFRVRDTVRAEKPPVFVITKIRYIHERCTIRNR
jgi:hypothetical protein